ncbi:MAG: cytochrome c oxidase subunit II [Nocardioidaceae bacterium]
MRRVAILGSASLGMLLLGGCSSSEQDSIKRLAQPVGVTDRTSAIHNLWMGAWLAAMVTGVLVWGLIAYACVKFRRRRDDEIPVQTRYNLPIEILYTVAPIVMVLVFFYFTVVTQNHTLASADTVSGKPDHTVTVVGQQWSWTFNYDKDQALDGKTTVYTSGTPAYRPTLVLPVDKSVEIKLRSADVIHSFWVPAFLFKMDDIPGRNNHFSFTPTRKGTFVGRCAELCGVYHSRMLFKVKVVDEADYATYLQKLKTAGNIGPLLGGSEITKQAGLGDNSQIGDGQ